MLDGHNWARTADCNRMEDVDNNTDLPVQSSGALQTPGTRSHQAP